MKAGEDTAGPYASNFPSTQWSLVLAAGDDERAHANVALAELCRSYWRPLYAYVRRRGFTEADAKDMTQDFFVFLLEHKIVAKAERDRGRFRTFLLAALSNFLADQRNRRIAQKRGGGVVHLSWNETDMESFDVRAMPPSASAEVCFDAAWAHTLASRALDQVRQNYEQRSRGELFNALRNYLVGGELPSYAEAGRPLQLSEAAVTSAIHRLRRDYRAALRYLVADTVRDVADIDDELRYLMMALAQTHA